MKKIENAFYFMLVVLLIIGINVKFGGSIIDNSIMVAIPCFWIFLLIKIFKNEK